MGGDGVAMSEVVELTRRLVGTETINPPGNEADAAAILGGRLEAAGFDVTPHELEPERLSLVARWPGRGDRPALCLTGHLDTVPLGQADWSHEPFAGEVDGDRLYGRGTSDMKGGCAAIVVAAERVAQLGRGDAGLELVLCAGEETGCDGALALARADGALGRAGAVLVAEPTSNYPCVAHKGVAWLDAVAEGRTAHGSMPHLGDNAIYKLARAMARLEEFGFDVDDHPLLGAPTLNVGTIAGGININSVPDRAVAGIDVRTVPGLDGDGVAAALDDAVGPDVRIVTRLSLDAIDTDPEDEWVHTVYEVMEPLIGERPQARGLAYFTDAAALAPAYGTPPTIICGPGDAEQAHRTDESCSVRNLEAAAEGLFEVARRWCGL
jgi:succinyl-diaminopimelate desuccinylase